MKQFITILGCALALAFTTAARAEEKEQELKGDACCLKCELKKSDKCQNVLSVKGKGGKSTLYVLEKNAVSEAFHKNVCGGPKKAVAKGVVKKDGDKNILVASKIEVDKADDK